MIAAIAAILLAQMTQCFPNNPAVHAAGETCQTVGAPSAGIPTLPSGGGDPFALVHALRERGREKRAGQLIADGKCGEARSFALREGDLGLAEHVDRLCATAAPPHP